MRDSFEPPKIIPGICFVETGKTVLIDGKLHKTVVPIRDTNWQHMKKPSYVITSEERRHGPEVLQDVLGLTRKRLD